MHGLGDAASRGVKKAQQTTGLSCEYIGVEVHDVVDERRAEQGVHALVVEECGTFSAHEGGTDGVEATGYHDQLGLKAMLDGRCSGRLEGPCILALVHGTEIGQRRSPETAVIARLLVLECWN